MTTISLPGLRERLLSWLAGSASARWAEVLLVILLAFALANLTWDLAPAPADAGGRLGTASASGQRTGGGEGADAGSGGAAAAALPASVETLFGTPPAPGEEERSVAEPVRETSLNLTLKGIVAFEGEGPKMAIIAPAKGDEKIYRPGDKVPGGAEILRIEPRRVVLLRNGVTEALHLKVKELEGRPEGLRSGGGSGGGAGIRRTGEHQRTVTRQALQRQLQNLPKLLQQAKAVPHTRNGRQVGFRVVNIQKGSVFEQLGIQEGDVIQSVNSKPIRTPQEALSAYQSLKSADAFRVNVTREGRQVTLNYSVQ
jgi:general secretion pathway protein C